MTVADYLSRLAVALPLILAMLGAGWYAARRGWIKPLALTSATPNMLRTVAVLGLGPGSRLVAIEFEGRRLLLAVTRSGTTLIEHDRGDVAR